jgi:iron complex outermembrane recepter protein
MKHIIYSHLTIWPKVIVSLLTMIFLSSPLLAQIVYNESDTIRLPEVRLDEIEITSMRESGKLFRLPLSAGVLNLEQMREQNVKTLKNASRFVANVFMPDYGSRLTSPVYIRGIGSRINAPSVGLYVDNIPYFEKSVFEFDLLNADRIEVLRGPQGTLYGRNTMGGLINVYSQSPFSRQGSGVSLSGGNPGYFNGMLTHQQLISPVLGISASAGINRHDGFFKNEHLGQMADAFLSAGGRVKLGWQINSSLMAEFTTHYEHLDQGGYPYAVHNNTSGVTQPVSYNEPSSYQRNMMSNGLLFSYVTPRIHVQSVSAFQHFSDNQSIDQDFSVNDLVFAIQQQTHTMFSQEFTARSNHEGNYQWVLGLFGFHQQLDNDLAIRFGEDAVTFGMVPGMLTRNQLSFNMMQGAALFHQSALNNFLLEGMTLTAGIRLDYESASLEHSASMEADFPTPPPSGFESDLNFYEWLPRLALNYAFSERQSLYGAIVRGYKTGGFNVVFDTDEDRSFDPEYSWNFEVGMKGRYWNDRLSVQSSLFYIDWKNQQIYQLLSSGQGSMLKNAGVSVSKGLEFELQALLVKNLHFSGSYGYTHATFIENNPNPDTDLSGKFIPYVPRQTMFAGLRYHYTVKSGFLDAIRLHVGYQGVGRHYWNDANTFYQGSYGIVNTMVSFVAGDFRLDLFANNITATEYHSFSFAALGNHYVQQGRPATFGMNLHYSF